MHYLGGKFRLRNQIAGFIQPYVKARYFEPFCGSAWVGEKIEAPIRVFSDVHPQLIALWNAVMLDWVPPERVSEEEYQLAMRGHGEDYWRGFIGFGCSYSGKWFGGYARNGRGDNYASQARNSFMKRANGERNYAGNARSQLLKRKSGFGGATFLNWDYREVFSLLKPGDVVYCDPPYLGTTSYDGTEPFDHGTFWDSCRGATDRGALVFVSEYQAPPDIPCVLEMPTRTSIRTNDRAAQNRVEKLFLVG